MQQCSPEPEDLLSCPIIIFAESVVWSQCRGESCLMSICIFFSLLHTTRTLSLSCSILSLYSALLLQEFCPTEQQTQVLPWLGPSRLEQVTASVQLWGEQETRYRNKSADCLLPGLRRGGRGVRCAAICRTRRNRQTGYISKSVGIYWVTPHLRIECRKLLMAQIVWEYFFLMLGWNNIKCMWTRNQVLTAYNK